MTTHQNTAYRLSNWGDYSRSLKERGNVTLWVDPSTLSAWRGSGRFAYSNLAIEVFLKVRSLLSLPLRQSEGFLEGLAQALSLDLAVPDYSTVSRRSESLEVALPLTLPPGPIHIAIDSSGLKVYGEGEWKVRQHGTSKRRTWVKLHLAVDVASGLIVARGATSSSVADGAAAPELLGQATGSGAGSPAQVVDQVSADGVYDWESVRTAIAQIGATATIPPRKDALLQGLPPVRGGPTLTAANLRNLTIHRIVEGGRSSWARESGYTRRQAAEYTFSRYARSFGGSIASRKPETQRAEVEVKCALLNEWTNACAPASFKTWVPG